VAPSGLRLSTTGGVATVQEEAAVRQAVLLLLSTVPGERVMRPDYGCELHRLVFAPNDDTTAGLAIHYVRRALVRWEPRIDILHLDANRSPEDDYRLDISLECAPPGARTGSSSACPSREGPPDVAPHTQPG